ncbi:MAG: cobalamin biosynthesis protein P47K, partial [Planctomycetaceae bacterium]|nr:cobalamin biosynthesis protein P47K [Planctomycetaceae bacterium]
NYIFRKQIEEADFVVINRIDELPVEQVNELQSLIENEYPGRPVLRCSAKTGDGFDALTAMLEQRGQFGTRLMEVDYDIYAEGEAELGWLNSQVTVEADQEFALDELLTDLIGRLHGRLVATDAEAAHLKVIGLCDHSYAVANLVSNAVGPEMSLASSAVTRQANVVVNARVATDPAELESIVRTELAAACGAFGLEHKVVSLQSFRPGRPVPTHRIH